MSDLRANRTDADADVDAGDDADVGCAHGVNVGIASRPSSWDLGPPTVRGGDRWSEGARDHEILRAVDSGLPARAMSAEDSLLSRTRLQSDHHWINRPLTWLCGDAKNPEGRWLGGEYKKDPPDEKAFFSERVTHREMDWGRG